MCLEGTSWVDVHFEGGAVNNLTQGIHVKSGIEANCSQSELNWQQIGLTSCDWRWELERGLVLF